MSLHQVSLGDRYDVGKSRVLLSGFQGLVRLPLMQKERDRAAGHNTAGFVTGYRGSPLGAVDIQAWQAEKYYRQADIRFRPGLNEDLAATSLWGAQQAHLRGEGRFDGVFGLWYGKGPGVDRSGDVFRHANMAGTAEFGGVLVAMGDDHTGESSTVLHHSEFALVDALMPILSPAGVQEVLDYGIIGWALSRYSGCWVGIKCVKDTVEVTEVVNADPHRVAIKTPPDFEIPVEGLNIRLGDTPPAQEARLHDYKRFAAEAFARANQIDHEVFANRGARIGIVSAGKSWLDTAHALELLGIDAEEAEHLGISTYKVGMVWPLDMQSFREWAEGLDLIICVEEKRKLIEVQVMQAIFNDRHGRRVIGWKRENGDLLFSVKGALDPVTIARGLADVLTGEGVESEKLRKAKAVLDDAARDANAQDIAQRLPWFCSGCPHNSSTKLPEGARAYAGIGCHYMVQWMDRETEGFTHMGGEGANWVGEAPFSNRPHVFQNMGDGTYNHSGVQAIRAALAAGDINITFKILHNDAVAMTGGQRNDGGLSPQQIAHELVAMGVKKVVGVYDPKETPALAEFPSNVRMVTRDRLMEAQEELQATEGVSAIIYIQTCAAEKRRRRKRGTFPDPDRRVFINPDVCEGCGDCGVKSNCVSIVPLDTELGRKRAIDQSSCNKDFSCLEGFCPSFVTLEGARPRKAARGEVRLPDLPHPNLPVIDGTFNIVVTGVGGTGVVTVGALLAMAAHLEGKGAGVMEMAGLAQKGGAVHIHARIANRPEDISAVRVAVGEADAVIGGDLVVTSGAGTLNLMRRGRTGSVCNTHRIITGAFTKDREFRLPIEEMETALAGRVGAKALSLLDATALTEKFLGDAIFANVAILGAAWQAGLVPLSLEALQEAIRINGAGVEGNLSALSLGRWAIAFPKDAQAALGETQPTEAQSIEARIALRADHLVKYQNTSLADRYRDRVARARAANETFGTMVAEGYHKLLAYKDEYEVARLHRETLKPAIDAAFEGTLSISFYMAPPILSRRGPDGQLKKRKFGPWMFAAMGVLARLKFLRGTTLDPFGYTEERKMERKLIRQYEADIDKVQAALNDENLDAAVALAKLPMSIRGFGHVKKSAVDSAEIQRQELLDQIFNSGSPLANAAE